MLPWSLIVRAHIRPVSAPPHLCVLRELCVEIPPSLVYLRRTSLGISTPRLYAFSEASVPKSFEISTLKILSSCTIIHPKSFRMNTYEKRAVSRHVSPFRMNTCKSVSKQRTLTTFRMNTYEKHRGVGLLWLTRHPVKDVCPVCPELLGERRSGARDLSRPARARRDKFRGAATRRLTRKRPEGSAADEAGGEDVSS